VFVEHLGRLETAAPAAVLAGLCHGLYHLLALAGVAPEVHQCCRSRLKVVPDLLDSDLASRVQRRGRRAGANGRLSPSELARISGSATALVQPSPVLITATDVALLQQLSKPEILSTVVFGARNTAS
jgi:DNA repair protein RecO (recombination protein O)